MMEAAMEGHVNDRRCRVARAGSRLLEVTLRGNRELDQVRKNSPPSFVRRIHISGPMYRAQPISGVASTISMWRGARVAGTIVGISSAPRRRGKSRRYNAAAALKCPAAAI